VQALPAAQAVLQLPQCRLSLFSATQSLPHCTRPLAQVALAPAAPALEPVPAADTVLLAPLPPVPLVVVPALPPVASAWSLDEPEVPGELEPDSPMWASQPWLSPMPTSTAHFHKRLAEARQVEKSIM
jgi:hypothetical protein